MPTSADNIDKIPAFSPEITDEANKFRKIELPLTSEAILDNNTTRTIFLWVAKIPEQTESPWTRAFAKVKYRKPILTNAAWDGVNSPKIIPVYYTNSDFSRTGSTMAMSIDDVKTISPIDRMAYIYASKGYSSQNGTGDPNLTPLGLGINWVDREAADYSLYTLKWLIDQNYLGSNPTPMVFNDAT